MDNLSDHIERSAASVELYGSFRLGDMELAIPVAQLQEVVNAPASVTRTPLAPPHLIGIFNLRGTLIPIVDLRQMLRAGEAPPGCGGKVAIVELGDTRVGLQFDATSEILRVPAADRIPFERAEGDANVMEGCIKLDGGNRILQILSVSALLGLPAVPRMQQRVTSTMHRSQQAQRRQTVSFRVADAMLALPMSVIREIIRVPSMHASPFASDICVGMLNLRGMIVPVVDFARLIGVGSVVDHGASQERGAVQQGLDDERRIVVLMHETVCVGLLVDEVRSIVAYRDNELLAMPGYAQRHADLFAGCLENGDGGNIILLKADALCTYPAISEVTHAHRDLYKDGTTDAATDKRRHRGARETWVTFRLNHLFGVPISQLREVIDYPDDVVPTPGMPEHVLGMLNLRRELITLLDVRKLHEMSARGDSAQAKVLIVEHRGEKYGLVVDALDNIVTIDTADRIKIPAVLTQQAGQRLSASLTGAVEVPDRGTLMLMDLATVVEQGAATA